MSDRRYHFVLNPRSGTALALGLTSETLRGLLESQGYEATIDADDDAPFPERIERARACDCEVVVAAGGDGTASGLAAALAGSHKTLAVMPLGTVNSLAKDISVPLDIDSWLATLRTMEPRRIDVGEVNGRLFLHMVVIGLIPGLAKGREVLRGKKAFAAKIGLLQYFLRRLSRARRLAIQIDPTDGDAWTERIQSVAVVCNAYEEGLGKVLIRETLDGGELTLYVLKRLELSDVGRLGIKMVLGHWQDDAALTIHRAREVTIRSHKPRLQVMLDGEIQSLEVPLHFKIKPQALSVLAAPTSAEKTRPADEQLGS